MRPQPETALSIRHLRRHLGARGYREAITYSFVDPELQHPPSGTGTGSLEESDLGGDGRDAYEFTARSVSAVLHNVNRQQPAVRLFESGLRLIPADYCAAPGSHAGDGVTGQRFAESWSTPAAPLDYFDLKGDLESLLALTRVPAAYGFEAASHPASHPGQTARITRKGQDVGLLGAPHPSVGARLGLSSPLFVCEIDLAAVLETAQIQNSASCRISRKFGWIWP